MLPRLPALALLLTPALAGSFENDFSDYPSGAQDCLGEADAQSGCSADTVEEMNACLCSDTGDFLIYTAACVAVDSYDDLGATYDLLTVNCDGTDTPLEYSEDEFLEAADAAADSADPDDPDPKDPDPKDPDPKDPDPADPDPADPDPAKPKQPPGDGLSTGATAGIAVGATAAGAGLIGLAIFLFLRRRRAARAADESNPMLAAGRGGAPNTMTPDTAYTSPFHDSKSPALGPEGVGAAQMQQWHGPEAGGNEVYELASTTGGPVEMDGSQPVAKS